MEISRSSSETGRQSGEIASEQGAAPSAVAASARSHVKASSSSGGSVKARLAMFEQQQTSPPKTKITTSPNKLKPRPRSIIADPLPLVPQEDPLQLQEIPLTMDEPVASTSKLDPAPLSEPLNVPSRPSSAASSSATASAVTIFGIVLVDFDHALGPKVEYSYPDHLKDDSELCTSLPFLALPDGAHMRDEDYSYFHLLSPTISSSTVFGISCNRQISSDQLVNRTAEITRSTVQKAIVVLASKPVFGPIRDKLGVITRAFFAQKDFGETSILVDFFASLESGLGGAMSSSSNAKANLEMEENAMYMGASSPSL